MAAITHIHCKCNHLKSSQICKYKYFYCSFHLIQGGQQLETRKRLWCWFALLPSWVSCLSPYESVDIHKKFPPISAPVICTDIQGKRQRMLKHTSSSMLPLTFFRCLFCTFNHAPLSVAFLFFFALLIQLYSICLSPMVPNETARIRVIPLNMQVFKRNPTTDHKS